MTPKLLSLFSSEQLTNSFLARRALLLLLLFAVSSLAWKQAAWITLGVGLGYFYMLSLIVTKRIKLIAVLQAVVFCTVSLLRIVFFGYAFLWLAQGDRMRVLLVFTGFLGYSSWIFLGRLLSVLGVFPVSRKLSA